MVCGSGSHLGIDMLASKRDSLRSFLTDFSEMRSMVEDTGLPLAEAIVKVMGLQQTLSPYFQTPSCPRASRSAEPLLLISQEDIFSKGLQRANHREALQDFYDRTSVRVVVIITIHLRRMG